MSLSSTAMVVLDAVAHIIPFSLEHEAAAAYNANGVSSPTVVNRMNQKIESLRAIAKKAAAPLPDSLDEALIAESVSYLGSDEAAASIADDAYWPKWNSPWWHMMLLHELGLTERIPERAVESIVKALQEKFLRFFPFREEEVPEGMDPLNSVACHCQLGTIYGLLFHYGLDIDSRLPWIRPWFLKYQLPDGGLNCDEEAYIRSEPKSSVVSTLPSLEAILLSMQEGSAEEADYLEKGASYLISKRLFRSSCTGEPIIEGWTKLSFPRFYEYDILRGLSFLLSWSKAMRRPLPLDAIAECIELVDGDAPDGVIKVQRQAWGEHRTRKLDRATGEWIKEDASTFPLLSAASRIGSESRALTAEWSQAKNDLLFLLDNDLVRESIDCVQ